MERLSWMMELIDRISGPANRASRALRGMGSNLGAGKQGLMGAGSAATFAGSSFLAMGAGLGGWTMLATKAWDIASGLASGIWNVASAIGEAAFKGFAFKESTLATMKALYGSADAADMMFKKAVELAKLTPFNVQDVAGAFAKVSAAGFKIEEVPVVVQGLADIASMSGRGADGMNMMVLAMSQVMGKGKLMSQELNQMTEAAPGAVSAEKLFREIEKIMGATEGTARSMMENGLIPARVAMMGLMQVSKNLSGGVIGQNSIEQSKTLGGIWSNLQDTISNMWLTMDLTKQPWFTAVKKFLAGMVDALDTSTRSGKVLQGVFENLFGKTVGAFIGNGTQDMTQTIIDLAKGFEHLALLVIAGAEGMWIGLKKGFEPLLQGLGLMGENQDDINGMRLAMEQLGQALSTIVLGFASLAEAILSIMGPFQGLNEEASQFTDGLVQLFTGSFGAVGMGLIQGLQGNFGGAIEILEQGGEDMIAAFGKILGIHSPSKVFEGFGENVVDGFNQGVGNVSGMDASLGESLAAGTAGRGLGSGAGGGVNVALTVQVNATGGADGDAIAQRLSEVLPSTLASIFDQLALERGLA